MAEIELREALKQEGINLDTGEQQQKGDSVLPVEGDTRSVVVDGVTTQERYEAREEGADWYVQGEYADSIHTDQLVLRGVNRGVFETKPDGSIVSAVRPSFSLDPESLIGGDTNIEYLITGTGLKFAEGSDTLLNRIPQPLTDQEVITDKLEFKVTRTDFFKSIKIGVDIGGVATKVRLIGYLSPLRRPEDLIYDNVSEFKFNLNEGDQIDTLGEVELSKPTYGSTGAILYFTACTEDVVTYKGTLISSEFVPYFKEWYYPAEEPVKVTTESNVKEQYEAFPNTNAFEDLEKTKLAGIESGAQVNTVTAAQVNNTTGYANYLDSSTDSSSRSYSSGVEKLLINDKASPDGSRYPNGVTSYWDSINNKFTPDQADGNYSFTIDFTVDPSTRDKRMVVQFISYNAGGVGIDTILHTRTVRLQKDDNELTQVSMSFTIGITAAIVTNGVSVVLTFEETNAEIYGITCGLAKCGSSVI